MHPDYPTNCLTENLVSTSTAASATAAALTSARAAAAAEIAAETREASEVRVMFDKSCMVLRLLSEPLCVFSVPHQDQRA